MLGCATPNLVVGAIALARVQRGLYLRQVTCQNDHAILAEIHGDATKIHENGPTPPSCTHLEHQVPAEAGGGECAGGQMQSKTRGRW